jgi:hypothetical protein
MRESVESFDPRLVRSVRWRLARLARDSTDQRVDLRGHRAGDTLQQQTNSFQGVRTTRNHPRHSTQYAPIVRVYDARIENNRVTSTRKRSRDDDSRPHFPAEHARIGRHIRADCRIEDGNGMSLGKGVGDPVRRDVAESSESGIPSFVVKGCYHHVSPIERISDVARREQAHGGNESGRDSCELRRSSESLIAWSDTGRRLFRDAFLHGNSKLGGNRGPWRGRKSRRQFGCESANRRIRCDSNLDVEPPNECSVAGQRCRESRVRGRRRGCPQERKRRIGGGRLRIQPSFGEVPACFPGFFFSEL